MTRIRPAPISPTRPVPGWIPRPHYVGRAAPEPYRGPHVQTVETIERMRVAGRIAAQAARAGAAAVAPGVTTDALDAVVHAFLIDHGAYPSTLGYRGFPKSCCTSVNEVICHGIPDARPLEDGDLVKIDVTAFVDGVHGDTCITVFVRRRRRESTAAQRADRGGAEAGDRGGQARSPGERARAGDRELREAVRLSRDPRLHRPRRAHAASTPGW